MTNSEQLGNKTSPADLGNRPTPGPSTVRPIWDGETHFVPKIEVPQVIEPEAPQPKWTKELAFGSKMNPQRITGLDAARGFALFGMIAVHILPAYNQYTNKPTLIWQAFAGHSAGLFAVLAGVTIALLSGANNPYQGQRLRRARASLIVRALLIFVIGLGINQLAVPVFNILPYYGLMFLIAVPLLKLRIRWLLTLSLLIAVCGPILVFFINRWGQYSTMFNPNFSSLISYPTDTLLTLFLGGTYPAGTWMAYICLGMAVGRLNLRWLLTSARLIVGGVGLALVGFATSTFLIDFAGGFRQLYYYTDNYEVSDISDVLTYGPSGHLPTDTWWWLLINGPHTNVPLAIISTAGLALIAIGSFLVIARILSGWIFPLIAAGSMTMTLYTLHLLCLTAFSEQNYSAPMMWFVIQVVFVLIFATGWQIAVGRGPMETFMARSCSRVARLVVPDRRREEEKAMSKTAY
ncbi:membrane protein [Corynebacterium kutscheri]|uniref:Membrane protein n=1 Tax=Corynebacterium kutscheri TaxID=35755 RepID=A0A0F6TCE3_9CORY|nr:heparan-alpha-glucosaminide N-acetyltransferase domain-containing protein [Corynebacterium kutscheri]AKE40264.1 putative membrane protein [Corynebacterium kutscheri]VEH05558.1 membrane protein [Corynebacterium kutscheri]VEH10656.1 membrane protein [Corynebacterium kutscheri]VEH81452.1 membrane protein [Corynebacterium kutscheri]